MNQQPQQQTTQSQLSQNVEREVRTLIGDLHMQVIVLKQMIDMMQPQQPSPSPKPKENPHPMPTEPTPPPKPVPQPPGPQEHERVEMKPVIPMNGNGGVIQ